MRGGGWVLPGAPLSLIDHSGCWEKKFAELLESGLGDSPHPICFGFESAVLPSRKSGAAGPRLSFSVEVSAADPPRAHSGDSTLSVETLALTFSKFEWRYTPFDATGPARVAVIQT